MRLNHLENSNAPPFTDLSQQ